MAMLVVKGTWAVRGLNLTTYFCSFSHPLTSTHTRDASGRSTCSYQRVSKPTPCFFFTTYKPSLLTGRQHITAHFASSGSSNSLASNHHSLLSSSHIIPQDTNIGTRKRGASLSHFMHHPHTFPNLTPFTSIHTHTKQASSCSPVFHHPPQRRPKWVCW